MPSPKRRSTDLAIVEPQNGLVSGGAVDRVKPGPQRDKRVIRERPFDAEGVSVEPPLIPAGVYQAVGGKSHRFRAFNADKLMVEWAVLVPDADARDGVRRVLLPRYYNVEWLGPDRFKVGPHTDYRREWIGVSNRRPTRSDRLSPRVFAGALAMVRVRTVKRDSRQRPLPALARYSVIEHITTVVAGGAPVR